MKKIVFAVVTAIFLSSCSNPMPDLKSPCVGAEGSPCERHPVNKENQG